MTIKKHLRIDYLGKINIEEYDEKRNLLKIRKNVDYNHYPRRRF